MASDAPGRAALMELDKILSERPHVDGHVFSSAAHHLAGLREEMIARAGESDAARRRLTHVNAVISVVLAGHFPLGVVPWEELEKARAWLADAVAEVEP